MSVLLSAGSNSISPRLSCRHHYLASILKTSVLPLKGEDNSVSNIVCHMPKQYKGIDTEVLTEVHSGLEIPYKIADKRSVNFQISDLSYLRELIRWSDCRQNVTVEWKDTPEHGSGSFILSSLLNESIDIRYVEGNSISKFELVGPMAGIRHIFPQENNYPKSATVVASSLICRQRVLNNHECLIHSKVEVDFNLNSEWSYEFAFRTDRSDQNLFSLHTAEPETVHIRLEKDFFIRVDSSISTAISHLSDSNWHTVSIHSNVDELYFNIDGSENIPILSIPLHDSRIKTVEITLDGEILLIDQTDINENCKSNKRRRFTNGSTSPSLCSACECTIMTGIFDNYPGTSCPHNDDEAYQFLRHPDHLSLFHIPNVSRISADGSVSIQTALSFKSDSDTGLLLFGYWLDLPSKGRFQVHYYGRRLTAVHCQNNEKDYCIGCFVERNEGFGNDQWLRVAFYGLGNDFTLVVDKQVCVLKEINTSNNISTAEIYSIPTIAQGNGLFVGGTFYEKKRAGLYHPLFEHKYFENTREKVPSLRGCIKDVYAKAKKVDLTILYRNQMMETLLDTSDMNAYSIQIGCATCDPSCPANVRCRATTPTLQLSYECDCSDVEQTTTSEGKCEPRLELPVPLTSDFVSVNPVVISLDTTKALLSKIWMKVKLPSMVDSRITLAEFNSHRDILFRIYIEPDGFLKVQVHPHNYEVFETSAGKRLLLSDKRVHLITLERRTPLGTRHIAKKYDLYIDGTHNEVPDTSKDYLNNISIPILSPSSSTEDVIIYDFGISYDYDEHAFLHNPSNRLHQVNVHSKIISYLIRKPNISSVGLLDKFLWEKTTPELKSSLHGDVTVFTPNSYEPQQLLSSRWLLYSLILTSILCLLLTICLLFYCCVLRRGSSRDSRASDRDRILRESPDYPPVKIRQRSENSTSSYDGEGSIGTDDTDLNAYRDIPSHRVKIYRESMVSILVPNMDQPGEAAIVKRSSVDDKFNSLSSSNSPAPLVNVDDQ